MIRGTYKILAVLLGAIIIAGLVSCTSDRTLTPTPAPIPATAPGWMEIELTDVATGEKFRISDFKGKPNSEVLSQDTGFTRQYGRDPYGGYYEDDFILFPVENEDDRIHSKTIVLGVEINGTFKAYREDDLKELKTIEDTVGGVNIRIEREDAGTIMAINLDTGAEIVAERGFWFAWYAFHPETGLYSK